MTNVPLESRVDALAAEVEFLKGKYEKLSCRLATMESGRTPCASALVEAPAWEAAATPFDVRQMPEEESFLSWVGRQALLPRIAAVCFMLVFALLLRTITDKGIIEPQSGLAAGMVYVVLLIIWGARLYQRKNRLAPVFPAWGLLLLFTIILETKTYFHSLSGLWAYIYLLGAIAVAMTIGLRYRATLVIYIGVVGAAVTGMAIDFPYLFFPLIGVVLLAGNIGSCLAWRQGLCPSLRWVILFLSLLFWLLWGLKIHGPLLRGEMWTPALYPGWYPPFLLAFFVYYLGVSGRHAAGGAKFGFYDGVLPTLNLIFFYWGAKAFLARWPQQLWYLGLTIMVLATAYFILASQRAGKPKGEMTGVTAFSCAGVAALALGLPLLSGDIVWALPIWSATAFLLAQFSYKWQSDGVRSLSCLFQIFVFLAGIKSGAILPETRAPMAATLAAGLISLLSLQQYSWCRTHPAQRYCFTFSWLERRDMGALGLLLVGLGALFCSMSLGLYLVLHQDVAESRYLFSCFQTVLLNLIAIVLLVVGSRRKMMEIIMVGIMIAVFGGFKAFLFDLFKAQGWPLIFSVLSFGAVATVGSVVLGRWQKNADSNLLKQKE